MIGKVASLIKSYYYCLKLFEFNKALRLPIIVNWRTKIKNAKKGCVLIPDGGRLRIGMAEGSFEKGKNKRTYLNFNKSGKLEITDHAIIPAGSIINIDGILHLGKEFGSNAFLTISATKHIHIGDNVAIGWEVTIIDGDGHYIYDENGRKINDDQEVYIGNNVWLCAKTTVLKGSYIADNNVVAYGSILSGKFLDKGNIIGGIPAKVIKRNITWKK